MLTAAITGAIAAILAMFGVQPGPYLIGVAIVVKVAVVLGVLGLVSRVYRKLRGKAVPPEAP